MFSKNMYKTLGLILSILLIQIVAIFGAIFTAIASERFGNIVTLIVINLIWALVCIYAFFIKTPCARTSGLYKMWEDTVHKLIKNLGSGFFDWSQKNNWTYPPS